MPADIAFTQWSRIKFNLYRGTNVGIQPLNRVGTKTSTIYVILSSENITIFLIFSKCQFLILLFTNFSTSCISYILFDTTKILFATSIWLQVGLRPSTQNDIGTWLVDNEPFHRVLTSVSNKNFRPKDKNLEVSRIQWQRSKARPTIIIFLPFSFHHKSYMHILTAKQTYWT